MTPASIVALAFAMLILAIIPGPGVMATVARALGSGFKPARSVVGGIVAGDLVFLLSAIYGLAYLAELLGAFFVVVRILGGAYLIWMGIRMLMSAGDEAVPAEAPNAKAKAARSDFLSGLAITLGNPKVIVFYLSFLPAFMDLGALTILDVLVAALVVSLVLGAVMLAYAFAAARARSLVAGARATKRMKQGAGAMLIGSGSLLLAKSP